MAQELTTQVGVSPLADCGASSRIFFRSLVGTVHLADKRHGVK